MDQQRIKTAGRLLLGAGLIYAGISHLTFARKEFQAKVPDFAPIKKDDTVVYSGLVEIGMGASLIAAPKQYREKVGKLAASFFTAVFHGKILRITLITVTHLV